MNDALDRVYTNPNIRTRRSSIQLLAPLVATQFSVEMMSFFSRLSERSARIWIGLKQRTGFSTEALICLPVAVGASLGLANTLLRKNADDVKFAFDLAQLVAQPNMEVHAVVQQLATTTGELFNPPTRPYRTRLSAESVRILSDTIQNELRRSGHAHLRVYMMPESQAPLQVAPPDVSFVAIHFATSTL